MKLHKKNQSYSKSNTISIQNIKTEELNEPTDFYRNYLGKKVSKKSTNANFSELINQKDSLKIKKLKSKGGTKSSDTNTHPINIIPKNTSSPSNTSTISTSPSNNLITETAASNVNTQSASPKLRYKQSDSKLQHIESKIANNEQDISKRIEMVKDESQPNQPDDLYKDSFMNMHLKPIRPKLKLELENFAPKNVTKFLLP